MSSPSTILFAGGGTGGHIFPSLAVVERLTEQGVQCKYHFLVSTRPLDTHIVKPRRLAFTALPVRPLPKRVWDLVAWPGFARAWFSSVRQARRVIGQTNAAAVVAMGGYVSAPAVAAAYRSGLSLVVVNLDTPPGKANRLMARRATKVFTVCPGLPGGERIGLPLRRCAVGDGQKPAARCALGLDPDRDVLFVTGGSQGADTLNQMMARLVTLPEPKRALQNWQVLHLAGIHANEPMQCAYAQAGIDATVQPFCDQMGLAWTAATVAISRAGAGSVAEAHANGTPTVFLPYPYHADLHQKNNAQDMVDIGGAQLYDDLVDPVANAQQLARPLVALMNDPLKRHKMTQLMHSRLSADGAQVIATWLSQRLLDMTR